MSVQPIYYITSLDPVTAAIGTNTIGPGPNLISIPLTISSTSTMITMIQNSSAEDQSLRVWVSTVAGGTPITPIITTTLSNGNTSTQNYSKDYWSVADDSTCPFVIFSATAGHGTQANFSSHANAFYVLVPNGVCYINVLNMVNSTNSFTFAQGSP